MDTSGYKKKFKALFDKLLRDNFELSEYHSENLVKYLDGSADKRLAKVLETPFFAELLIHALKNDGHASLSVKVFITKLVSIVLRNEVHFNRFVQMQGFELVFTRARGQGPMPPELMLASVQQAIALTAHYFGVKYTIETKTYSKVLDPYRPEKRHETPEVLAVVYEFITKLIWKLDEYEEEDAMMEVFQFLVKPLMDGLEAESQVGISEPLLIFIQALVHVLGEVEHLVAPNNVVSIMSLVFSVEKVLTALEATQQPALARLLAELALRYCYATSRQAVLLDPDSESNTNLQLHDACNKIVCILIKKRAYETVLEFLGQCHAFWHKIGRIVPPVAFEKYGKTYLLQNQFLLLLLVPVFMQQRTKKLVSDLALHDANELFYSDLAQTITYDTVRTAYDLRSLILELEQGSLTAACAVSVRELLRLRGLLSQPQACVAFPALYYALSEYVLSDGAGALVLLLNPLRSPDDVRFLSHILDAIAMLLDEHEINWYESLEIVELQAALMNLIKQNILPIKLLVQAIDLITLNVRKLLSPELSLLMESRRGGSLREAAGVARALLQREEIEARIAALELLYHFTEVAYVKFLPLRNVLSENGLVVEAARCALGWAVRTPHAHEEARAQATALRCLEAATKCEDLWVELLTHCHNLYEQLVSILRYSPEGEVRKEAANVLSHVYINTRVSASFTSHVSRVMFRAATEDAHWPARLAALNYWKQIVRYQFTDRGMIDGMFPSVTFSKEKRKIIVLNDKEIHKQLEIIMGYLSTSGCLAVLLKCLEPHNNREVIEKTYRFISRIVRVLEHYKYAGDSSGKSSPKNVSMDAEMSQPSPQSPDLKLPIDLITEIFECLGGAGACGACAGDGVGVGVGEVGVVRPRAFLAAFRAQPPRRARADLDTLLDELLAL